MQDGSGALEGGILTRKSRAIARLLANDRVEGESLEVGLPGVFAGMKEDNGSTGGCAALVERGPIGNRLIGIRLARPGALEGTLNRVKVASIRIGKSRGARLANKRCGKRSAAIDGSAGPIASEGRLRVARDPSGVLFYLTPTNE